MTAMNVTGKSNIKIFATIAHMDVGIEVREKTSEVAQKKLAELQQQLLATLKERNVEKIEIRNLSLYPRYETKRKMFGPNDQVIVGYTAKVDVIFVASAKKAGSLLHAALTNGANKNHGITLRPSEEEVNAAKLKAIDAAAKDALAKAQTVLSSLNLRLKKITHVDIDQGYRDYHRRLGEEQLTKYCAPTFSLKTSPEIEVTEREIEVEAKVNLTVEFAENGRNWLQNLVG